MNFIEKHKALLFTFLITGTIILGMFSFGISKKSELITESFYEIEPQTPEELEQLEALKELEAREQSISNTNQAQNEDEAFKEMMKNFKSLSNAPTHDSAEPTEKTQIDQTETPKDVMTSNSSLKTSKKYALNDTERQSFNKANDILEMHSPKKSEENIIGNSNSSVSFSLRNRTKVKLPPPVYLCEVGGKIVINVTVNRNGQVVDTYINSSSSSNNQCLIDAATEYAKKATFSSDASKDKQLGSITYYFKEK